MKTINELLFQNQPDDAVFIQKFTSFIKNRCKDSGDSYDLTSNASSLTFSLNELGMTGDWQGFFYSIQTLGCLKLGEQYVAVFLVRTQNDLNERSCRRKQFDFAKHILSTPGEINKWFNFNYIDFANGLFLFLSPDCKSYRLSLVESRKDQDQFKRYTFFVSSDQSNRTFCDRMNGKKKWETFANLKETFEVEKLSDDFFKEYRDIYQKIITYATGKKPKKKNDKWIDEKIHEPKADIMKQFEEFVDPEKSLRDYVKKMMGRLVFLQFLAKKGWLGAPLGNENEPEWGKGDKSYLQKLFAKRSEKDNFLEAVLEPLFFDTLNKDRGENALADPVLSLDGKSACIPYLNGGLFEKDALDETQVAFPAKYFEELFDTFERYNFTIDENDPDDKEVGVDPEMLGRIFESLLEDNKDKGAFYTPKEIVQYMCEESLIAYLGDTEKNRKLVKEFDAEKIENKDEIFAKLKDIKICDPAIGSGAFPMGMLNILYRIRLILKGKKFTSENIVAVKKEIIQNNIYGVDIEAGAVDIARLRFWLSIVVDEDKPIPLPNLDYKIMQGNSLLEQYNGVDLSQICNKFMVSESSANQKKKGKKKTADDNEATLLDLFDDTLCTPDVMHKAMDYYFSIQQHNLKAQYKERINGKVLNCIKTALKQDSIEIDWNNNSEFFLWHTYFWDVFNQKGGFDIVIGNPPYVDSESMTKIDSENNTNYRNLYRNRFRSCRGNWDLFIAFIEQGISLGNENSTLSFIVPNKLLAISYANITRQLLAQNHLLEIRDYADADVFDGIDVYPCTFITKRNSSAENMQMTKMADREHILFSSSVAYSVFLQDTLWDKYFSEPAIVNVLLKMNMYETLSDVFPQISDAATTGEAYQIGAIVRELKSDSKNYFRLINTGTIDKFVSLWGRKSIRYLGFTSTTPIVLAEDLQEISRTRLNQACAEKIIIAGMSTEIEAYYDCGEYLAGKSTVIVLGNSGETEKLKAVNAIINSKLISFWLRKNYNSLSMQGGYLTIGPSVVQSIPIPKLADEDIKELAKINDIIQTGDDKKIQALENYVAKLYALSPEEIAIVEESLKKPVAEGKKEKGKKAAAVPAAPVVNDDNDEDDGDF